MRTLSSLLLLCVVTAVGSADEPAKADLKFAATFERGVLVILITNEADTLRSVVTAPADMTYDDKKSVLTLGLMRAKDRDGKLIVPSESELKVVKLNRGESAKLVVGSETNFAVWNALAFTAYEGLQKAVSEGKLDFEFKLKVSITYEVTEDWGKRFGVWSGKKSLDLEIGGRELPKVLKEK